jgi:hypothetical protein
MHKDHFLCILTTTSMHINRCAHVSCTTATGEESAASSLERGGHAPRESKEVPRQPRYQIKDTTMYVEG